MEYPKNLSATSIVIADSFSPATASIILRLDREFFQKSKEMPNLNF